MAAGGGHSDHRDLRQCWWQAERTSGDTAICYLGYLQSCRHIWHRVCRSPALLLKDQTGSTGGENTLRGFLQVMWDVKEQWHCLEGHTNSQYLALLQQAPLAPFDLARGGQGAVRGIGPHSTGGQGTQGVTEHQQLPAHHWPPTGGAGPCQLYTAPQATRRDNQPRARSWCSWCMALGAPCPLPKSLSHPTLPLSIRHQHGGGAEMPQEH